MCSYSQIEKYKIQLEPSFTHNPLYISVPQPMGAVHQWATDQPQNHQENFKKLEYLFLLLLFNIVYIIQNMEF